MKVRRKRYRRIIKKRVLASCLCLVLGLTALMMCVSGVVAAESAKLQNGSFEDISGQTWSNAYLQPDQSDVPYWNTTAYGGMIELFKENTGTYIQGVTLKPSSGMIAAELNADEESTLYQTVTTTPASIYEWGLDHGARSGTDTMALVIGPAQSVAPVKPDKNGRDQFMQMVDWLSQQGKTSVKKTAGMGEHLTVYSKKFATGGTFADNAGNNAFSLTPSTIYTEEWQIWIMASTVAASGTNPWNSYGSNAEGSAGSVDESGNTTVDTSKDYLYTVPAGQTSTLFGFVSVGNYGGGGNKTFGNFLDNINFQIYHPLTGSTTNHGSGEVGEDEVTVDNSLITYVSDGKTLQIVAKITKADAEAGCEFVGVYYTTQGEDGNLITNFLQRSGNEIEDTGSLTDAEKSGKWVKTTGADGSITYTYSLAGVTSATDLQFIFVKSPTVTYDPNGGKDYIVDRTYNTSEDKNVYSFKPATDVPDAEAGTSMTFIAPYVSHAAEGQNDGWKFMGWLLTGDTPEADSSEAVNAGQLGSLLLPAEHTIACDYSVSDGASTTAAQYLKIYEGNGDVLSKTINKDDSTVTGVTWDDSGAKKLYANDHKGLTMVAQWRWLQAFIPQVGSGSSYTDSDVGGTVEITSVTNTSYANYNAAYNANGGKSYHATTNEIVTAIATAKEGHTFEGWYDADGNLITTNATYSYKETKESVNTFYARFSGSVTQNYKRLVKDGDEWKETTNGNIGILDRYIYSDVVGTSISSTATAGTGYKFVGWYDKDGNKVADTMLTNNGATISYTTTGNATYYARFETAYTVKFAAQTKQANGSFKTDTVGGKVSVASVTDVANAVASSKATANSGYKFLGWYDNNGNQLSTNATYSTTTTSATNGVTYYARFEIVYTTKVSDATLSFIAESKSTQIPDVFKDRDAGTGKGAEGYGLDNKYGNTIATGFTYSINTMTDVSTIQITVTVPNTSYVKVGGNGNFTGVGTSILTDSAGVAYNKGSIQKIDGEKTLKYYWTASGLQANTDYGFIIDNLYAPGATATITVNGKDGTEVTSSNGVVNTASGEYQKNSHYPE